MRFEFGKNWGRFIKSLDSNKVEIAEKSLKDVLKINIFNNLKFIDIGSGSGLTSLAAVKLGASVTSFDYDHHSVECTQKLKDTFFPEFKEWNIEQGSILDDDYVSSLGGFDIVVSWGVLHHTGNMWKALENASRLTKSNGVLYLALYNDQGWISLYWKWVKILFNYHPVGKFFMIIMHYPYLVLAPYFIRRLTKRGVNDRGMMLWYDLIDWVGGYPFEVASIEQVVDFFSGEYELVNLIDVGTRHGCNEFVFKKK
jgi:2-polyprenyl-3-methyl-5-hydroxy-6-metoxy-1,4-benzoquinol methylase